MWTTFDLTTTKTLTVAGVTMGYFKRRHMWNSQPHLIDCTTSWTGIYPGSVEVNPESKWDDSSYAHCSNTVRFTVGINGYGAPVTKKFHTWGDRIGVLRGEYLNL